jgi:hypothetical protein
MHGPDPDAHHDRADAKPYSGRVTFARCHPGGEAQRRIRYKYRDGNGKADQPMVIDRGHIARNPTPPRSHELCSNSRSQVVTLTPLHRVCTALSNVIPKYLLRASANGGEQ